MKKIIKFDIWSRKLWHFHKKRNQMCLKIFYSIKSVKVENFSRHFLQEILTPSPFQQKKSWKKADRLIMKSSHLSAERFCSLIRKCVNFVFYINSSPFACKFRAIFLENFLKYFYFFPSQDMREMERRKRVELIMNSRLFREELERIIESQMRDGNSSAGLLQQISDMVGSKYGTNNHILKSKILIWPTGFPLWCFSFRFVSLLIFLWKKYPYLRTHAPVYVEIVTIKFSISDSSCVVPINDIRGIEAMGYAKGEKILRCKLAALFRLIELYGWSQNIYNHITVSAALSAIFLLFII